ncbi:MAG: hypothetical protein PHV74_13295 [Dehalococcoidia bacterium]|nr:hypothetical protein [Dehalococcoidia bacterium]
MKKVLPWMKQLGWKWWVLIATLMIFLIIFVATPAYVYYSRDRKPSSYSHLPALKEMPFLVTYDSGDGAIDQTERTLRLTETGVPKNSETCFHAVTLYNTFPKRNVSAPIVHSTTITLGEDEIWRSQNDLRMVSEKVMQTNLKFVNTALTWVTFSQYVNYPGWPYHLNDSWTYEASYDPDVPFLSGWTNTFRAEVVADDAVIDIGSVGYPCFKVVHTLVDTSNSTPSGGDVGSTITEYWYKDSKAISPIKIEDSVSYQGIETQTMSGTSPPPSL